MFIVKLILVPLWPFFICSWVNKHSTKGPLGFKGWVAGLLFLYTMMICGAMELVDKFAGKRSVEQTQTFEVESAPVAEVQDASAAETK